MTDFPFTDPVIPDEDLLAAEYVLGVLDNESHQRASYLIANSASFVESIEYWIARFAGFNGRFAPVVPPAHIQNSLNRRLFSLGQKKQRVDIKRWIIGATVATSFALLLAFFVNQQITPSGPVFVAELVAKESPLRLSVKLEDGAKRFTVSVTGGTIPPEKDLELWLIAVGQKPVSLGLVSGRGDDQPALPGELYQGYKNGGTIAVSLEPKGGSVTGQPTGPVIATGSVKKI